MIRPIGSASGIRPDRGASTARVVALVVAIAAVSPTAAAGDVYKCQDAAGRIEFRDRPCDGGHKGRKVDVTPNSVGTMTLEEVRARNAELKARQQARQDAENRANAATYPAQEKPVGDRGTDGTLPPYYSDAYPGQPLRPPALPRSLPPPLKSPAMPSPPPRPVGPG